MTTTGTGAPPIPDDMFSTMARHNLAVLCNAMRTVGMEEIRIGFDGEDGQGRVEADYPRRAAPADIAGLQEIVLDHPGGWARVMRRTEPFEEAVETVAFDLLESAYRGWEAKEGGVGQIAITQEDARIEFGERVESYEWRQHRELPELSPVAAGLDEPEEARKRRIRDDMLRENLAMIFRHMTDGGVEGTTLKVSGARGKLRIEPALPLSVCAAQVADFRLWSEEGAGSVVPERPLPLGTCLERFALEMLDNRHPGWADGDRVEGTIVLAEGVASVELEQRIEVVRRLSSCQTADVVLPPENAGLKDPAVEPQP